MAQLNTNYALGPRQNKSINFWNLSSDLNTLYCSEFERKFVKAVDVAYCALCQSERRKETVTLLRDMQIKSVHGLHPIN